MISLGGLSPSQSPTQAAKDAFQPTRAIFNRPLVRFRNVLVVRGRLQNIFCQLIVLCVFEHGVTRKLGEAACLPLQQRPWGSPVPVVRRQRCRESLHVGGKVVHINGCASAFSVLVAMLLRQGSFRFFWMCEILLGEVSGCRTVVESVVLGIRTV
jgi:hypothetical protein